MKRLLLSAALLMCAAFPALADMYPDASNAKLPEARDAINRASWRVPSDYGAKCDVRGFNEGGAWSAGGASFSPNNGVTVTGADVGKKLVVYGAGAGGSTYVGTITASSGTSWTVSPALTQAPGINFVYGMSIATPQAGAGSYAPGDTITLAGGTTTGGSNAAVRVTYTKLVSATVAAGGTTSLANGTYAARGTSGIGHYFEIPVTVAGGTVTALGTITTAGNYETNPGNLAAEPVQLVGGAGLSGTTLNLKMGVAEATIASPGGYSIMPGTLTHGTSSGTGTGAVITPVFSNVFMPGHYGQWYYGTDDAAAFASAITWAQTNQASVRVPAASKCGTGQTIAITANLTELSGESSGATTGDPSGSPVNSAIYWMGAADQPVIQIRTPDGGAKLHGSSVQRLAIIAANRAGFGLQIQSLSHADFADLYVEQARIAGIDLGTNTTLSGSDTQFLNFSQIYLGQKGSNGYMLRLDGDNTTAPGDVSGVTFQQLRGTQGQATGVLFRYAGVNTFRDVSFGPVYSTSVFAIEFACRRAGIYGAYCAYANLFHGFANPYAPVIGRGITSSGNPEMWSRQNVVNYSGDASPTPITEPMAQLTFATTYSEHGTVTTTRLLSGFLPNGQGYSQRDILDNTTAGNAFANDLLFTSGGSSIVGFNLKYRNDIPGFYYQSPGGGAAIFKNGEGCMLIGSAPVGVAGALASLSTQIIACANTLQLAGNVGIGMTPYTNTTTGLWTIGDVTMAGGTSNLFGMNVYYDIATPGFKRPSAGYGWMMQKSEGSGTLQFAAVPTGAAGSVVASTVPLLYLQQDGVTTVEKLVAAQAAPAAASACPPGRITTDANFIYVCATSGAWKRAALTAY